MAVKTEDVLKKDFLKEYNKEIMNEHIMIKMFSNNEIENYTNIIKRSFETVADDLEMTRDTFPASGAFIEKNDIRKLLNKGGTLFGLYKINATSQVLIACIALIKKTTSKYKIMKLAVLPEERNFGYGGLLMAFAEAYITHNCGQVISLGMVSENQVLKKWYQTKGFIITKVSPYKHTTYSICFMEKNLDVNKTSKVDDENSYLCSQENFFCTCTSSAKLKEPIYICLLTHENEIKRTSNTGQLIKKILPERTQVYIWNRLSPPTGLIELMEDDTYKKILVFPVEDDSRVLISPTILKKTLKNEAFDQKFVFLILDGTWKEARKMFRKSDYLSELAYLALEDLEKTRYTLRRNKDMDHICTVEVAIELLKICEEIEAANLLEKCFLSFVRNYKK